MTNQDSSRATPDRHAKSQPNRESATTQARDWFEAKQRGERLSAHELRCESCGDPSTAAVCVACIETHLEAEIHQ